MSSVDQEILVIKPSSLGDIIHGLQVVESMRVQNPHTRVTWVVADAFAPVVEACRSVDEVIIFQRQKGVLGFFRLLRTIRSSRRYDYVLDLQGLARSGLMTLAARSEHKIGRSDAREGARFFYNQQVELPAKQTPHAVEILSQFLPAIGLLLEVKGTLAFDLPTPQLDLPEDLSRAVLVFPESRRDEKTWPHFGAWVAKMSQIHPGRAFVWCGSPASSDACPEGPNVYNLAGKTTLLDVIALIQTAGAVIANDSGPIHIAAAVGTPVMALFGPTPVDAYGPYPVDAADHITLCSEDRTMASLSLEAVSRCFEAELLPLI